MATINAVGGNVNTNVVSTCIIKRFDTGVADTETSYSFPAGTKRFTITNDGAATVQFTFTSGESNTEYIKLPTATSHFESNLGVNASLTVYLRCPVANQTLEIVSWK